MSESKKTVLIHAGAGKTGTTAIQNCLLANAERLKQNGVWIPNDEYFLTGHPSTLQSCGNGVKLFFFLTDYADQLWFDKTEFLHKIEEALNAYRFAVFSCEYLQYVHANRLALFRDFCAAQGALVKIVYCVRDFASHAFSSWRQLVIYDGDFSEWPRFQLRYANDPALSGFEPVLRKFAGIVSRDNVMALNYSSLSHDMPRQFFRLFDQDYDDYRPAVSENVSDNNFVIDVMLEFNKMLVGRFDRNVSHRFYDGLRQLNGIDERPRTKVILSGPEYNQFREALHTQLDYVNGNFLADDPIVVAHPEQIGETGRPSDRRLAARTARKIAAGLANEVPSLRIFRPSPWNLLRRYRRRLMRGTA